jgi:dUTP pyrophosphatase
VILWNAGREPFVLKRGDRVAQLVVAPVAHAVLLPVETLGETPRGAGGFGHSGFSGPPGGGSSGGRGAE